MPLPLDTRDFLAQLNTDAETTISDISVTESRAHLSELFTAHAPEFQAVAKLERDVLLAKSGSLVVDIYQPLQPLAQPCPLVLLMHGGGWIQGDLACYENFARYLCAQAGVIVVNVGYRLAPEHPFPCGLEDGYTALLWAKQNCSRLGADENRLAVLGDSAGANLCAGISALCIQRQGPKLAAQFLLYPVLDAAPGADYPSRHQYGNGDYLLNTEQIDWTASLYLQDRDLFTHPLISPMYNDKLAGSPPTFLMTAACDPLRDEGKKFADKLSEANVPTEYLCFADAIHGFLSLAGSLASGKEGLELLVQKLKLYLGKTDNDGKIINSINT